MPLFRQAKGGLYHDRKSFRRLTDETYLRSNPSALRTRRDSNTVPTKSNRLRQSEIFWSTASIVLSPPPPPINSARTTRVGVPCKMIYRVQASCVWWCAHACGFSEVEAAQNDMLAGLIEYLYRFRQERQVRTIAP